MPDLKIGHLDNGEETLLNKIPIKNGQVIYSEDSGSQFVDYSNKRHVQGGVISSIYNNGYINLKETEISDVVNIIKTNGTLKDGQIIKVGNSVYMYRNIHGKTFIANVNDADNSVAQNSVGYVINIPDYASGDKVNIDLLISITNETNGKKLFLLKMVDNVLDLSACKDLDGTFDSANLNINITQQNGLFMIVPTVASTIKVISYGVTSTGSSANEGFYIAASDV